MSSPSTPRGIPTRSVGFGWPPCSRVAPSSAPLPPPTAAPRGTGSPTRPRARRAQRLLLGEIPAAEEDSLELLPHRQRRRRELHLVLTAVGPQTGDLRTTDVDERAELRAEGVARRPGARRPIAAAATALIILASAAAAGAYLGGRGSTAGSAAAPSAPPWRAGVTACRRNPMAHVHDPSSL